MSGPYGTTIQALLLAGQAGDNILQRRRDNKNAAAFTSDARRILGLDLDESAPALPPPVAPTPPPPIAGAFPLPEAETLAADAAALPPAQPPLALPAAPPAPPTAPAASARTVSPVHMRDLLFSSMKNPSPKNEDILKGLGEIFKSESTEERMKDLAGIRFTNGMALQDDRQAFQGGQNALKLQMQLQIARENNQRAIQVSHLAAKHRDTKSVSTVEAAAAQIAYLNSLMTGVVMPNPEDYKSGSGDLFDPTQALLSKQFTTDYATAAKARSDLGAAIRALELKRMQLGGAPAAGGYTPPPPGGTTGPGGNSPPPMLSRPGTRGVLPAAEARSYLQRAGGDPMKARTLAVQDGWQVK